MTKIANKAFGEHLREQRRALNLTQKQLAQRSGLSDDSIRRLEYGSFSPSLFTLGRLCVGLDLRLSELFERFERRGSAGEDSS